MPVIYIPLSMKNEKRLEEQKAYMDALMEEGWKLEPFTTPLKDASGTQTKFAVLKKDWDW